MEFLANPIEEIISVFDIQNDLTYIDTINNKIQQLDSIKDQNLTSFSLKIDGMFYLHSYLNDFNNEILTYNKIFLFWKRS